MIYEFVYEKNVKVPLKGCWIIITIFFYDLYFIDNI